MYVFGSVLTMIAATITLTGVLSNLDIQREQVEDAYEHKAQSARVFLPNVLSIFGERAIVGLHYNYAIAANGVISGLANSGDASVLALPNEAVVVFRDLIENSADEKLRNYLFELLREHQLLVTRSRRIGWRSTRQPSCEYYRHVAHWTDLYAVAGVIFDYARGDTETIASAFSEESMKGALSVHAFILPLKPTNFMNRILVCTLAST